MLSNFGWILPGRLAGMAYPGSDAGRALVAAGVGAVLSLTEHAPVEALADDGLVVRHEPIGDFEAPSPAVLARCVGFVRERWGAGQAVAVHCMAGRGRTGTVLAACLVAEGMDADAAIALVRAKRPGSIETRAQEACVRAFRPAGRDAR